MGGIRKVGSRWVAVENEATEKTLARQSIFSFVTQSFKAMSEPPRLSHGASVDYFFPATFSNSTPDPRIVISAGMKPGST